MTTNTRSARKTVAAKKIVAKKTATSKKTTSSKKTTAAKATAAAKKTAATSTTALAAPVIAPGTPRNYRARVRMYRHGLGDCFLLTFPRRSGPPFNMLIDCGALARDKVFMNGVVAHIRDTVRTSPSAKARLDVVVGTHEHKDHVSGFNQARELFNDEFDFGSVWLSWAEDLSKSEIQRIKDAKKKAVARLQGMVGMSSLAGSELAKGVSGLLGFSQDDDTTGAGKVADAMAYLKLRGKEAGDLRYLEPGGRPFDLEGVDGVRVYVLGPPKDPSMLKTSAVTEAMKRDHVVYHLSAMGDAGMDALGAALDAALDPTLPSKADRSHPFAVEHRVTQKIRDTVTGQLQPNPCHDLIRDFLDRTYDDPGQKWRRVDDDWLASFGQLALDLDNDTNNTSLVLAFEFEKTREVLLFVADAQIGSWLSWGELELEVPGQSRPLEAEDLLNRTVFYKVGHHCSHNATARSIGLELMTRDDLVAFIPLDQDTAKKQGVKGWDMPARPLFDALKARTGKRVVISDVKEEPPVEALEAGVIATTDYVDYFLR
jgi:hypothetical protein